MGECEVTAVHGLSGLAQFEAICRKAGVKLTHQRLEVFREITSAKDHPSAEDLYQRLRQRLPSVSMDTVYRTLDLLERCGVVSKVPVSQGPARFEGNPSPHHHCICSRCNAVSDVAWPDADALPLPQETLAWGRVLSRNIQLLGLCSSCSAHAAV